MREGRRVERGERGERGKERGEVEKGERGKRERTGRERERGDREREKRVFVNQKGFVPKRENVVFNGLLCQKEKKKKNTISQSYLEFQ